MARCVVGASRDYFIPVKSRFLRAATRARPSAVRRDHECVRGPTFGKIRMTSLNDLKTTIRRNKLLGMWAAEKLGLVGRDAEAYADALAVGSVDPERSDVFSKIRKDFDAASVVQSDDQILAWISQSPSVYGAV
jgi:hypothetical protein